MTNARRLWMVLGLAILAIALALDYANRPEPVSVDFHTYVAAARVGIQHGWAHIYDQALVAAEQKQLVPGEVAQPFLSTPPDAWLAAPLTPLPYWASFYIWAWLTFGAFALALAWSALSHGLARWIAVLLALTPWWVLHAVHVGQVVPLVAAGMLVAWRLLRERRDVLAGVAVSLLLLKPNTAFLVPVALLVAARYKAFAAAIASCAVIGAAAMVTMGPSAVLDYLAQLTGPLPSGADHITLEGAFGVSGGVAVAMRLALVAAALVVAHRLRHTIGFVLAVGMLASLISTPYLHGSDLCVLSAAAFMVWEERPEIAWRLPIVVGWLIASPYMILTRQQPTLNRWPLLELALLLALAVAAFRTPRSALTGDAELRTRATA